MANPVILTAEDVPVVYINSAAVSKMTGLSKATLYSWSSRGTRGPPSYKIGTKLVMYKLAEVEAWMQGFRRVPSSVQLAEANA